MGIGDTPQQAYLAKIPKGNFMQNRKVCTTLPCLPQVSGILDTIGYTDF
jgi:hypothetical protein